MATGLVDDATIIGSSAAEVTDPSLPTVTISSPLDRAQFRTVR